MRYLILFCLGLFLITPAHAAEEGVAEAVVKAFGDYCLPAIKDHKDPADIAVQNNLIELPAEQALKFSPEGGRVFSIPSTKGNAVLMTNKTYAGVCNIAIHEIAAEEFWAALDKLLDNNSGFSLMREKRADEDHVTKKEYDSDSVDGHITLLITASDVPRRNGMQGLITLARVQEK